MSQKGQLVANSVATFTFDTYVPSMILVGAADLDIPVNQLTVSIDGNPVQDVGDEDVIRAISRTLTGAMLGADVKKAQMLYIASGKIPLGEGKSCIVKLGNSGATTPNVYELSVADGGSPVSSGQSAIQDLSNDVIGGRDYLYFKDANVQRLVLTFKNGHVLDCSITELNALVTNAVTVTDADGKLNGVNFVPFKEMGLATIQIFASGGSVPHYFLNV